MLVNQKYLQQNKKLKKQENIDNKNYIEKLVVLEIYLL